MGVVKVKAKARRYKDEQLVEAPPRFFALGMLEQILVTPLLSVAAEFVLDMVRRPFVCLVVELVGVVGELFL